MALEVNICGSGTLKNDLDVFLKGVFSTAVREALDDVGEDMQSALAQHIETDVYAAYSPSMYERRGEKGGLIAQARTARIYINGPGQMSIEYKPDGTHPNGNGWSGVHGDDLIGRLEKHSPEYKWLPKYRKIPNRPFWQNFVSEMVDSGALEYFFANAMRRRGYALVETGEVFREPADGTY